MQRIIASFFCEQRWAMGFKIQIRLHDRKQKAHQTACHGVSIEEHMSFLYREDKDATAVFFSSWCCFPAFLAFVSVITFFPSSFYTSFDLSWTWESLILICYKGLTRYVIVYIWELNPKMKINQNKIISYSSVIGPAHILHQEKKNYHLSHSLCVNQKWKLNNWAYHAKHS